jgi:hypothetical protein
MRQDTDQVLARQEAIADLACMRQTTVIVLLGVVACSALSLLAIGVDASAVKEVLTIVFPPIVALAAAALRNDRRRL